VLVRKSGEGFTVTVQLVRVAALAAGLLGFLPNAYALCAYGDVLDATTSLDREFRDATLVVKGDVLSSQEITMPDGEDDVDYGVLYKIRIDHVFKGKAREALAYFSHRDSGGFYLQVGREYLLFLNPLSESDWAKSASGAMVVNYNCGQSRQWAEVSLTDRKRLNILSEQGSQ
jgi:hypothetical protein